MKLYETYGPQGWWPILSARESAAGALRARGYHPLDYSLPQQDLDRCEIAVGAILTQNTAWTNVEKAIQNLADADALTPKAIEGLSDEALAALVRPAGYYNQKAKKLKIFAAFFRGQKGRIPSRDQLLALWGVGKETADSILLYAYHEPQFVVDAYSRRILSALGLVAPDASYDEMQQLFVKELKRDIIVYQEYHALIVAHGKELSTRKGRAS